MIIIISESYKVITSCKTANNIHSTIIQITRNKIQIKASKESINELGTIKIISQAYKEITSCKTANIIPSTTIQIKRNNIQIKASKESINELDKK